MDNDPVDFPSAVVCVRSALVVITDFEEGQQKKVSSKQTRPPILSTSNQTWPTINHCASILEIVRELLGSYLLILKMSNSEISHSNADQMMDHFDILSLLRYVVERA